MSFGGRLVPSALRPLLLVPFSLLLLTDHPAVNLKSMETLSCWAILVGCIKISAHPVADLKLRGTS